MPVLKVKQNDEWVNVGSISGGITVDTENSNIGTPNKINADTLGGNTLQQIMLAMYPVGAIYMSANAVSPADLFGGTWERIEDRFLLAAGSSYTAGSTGGEATHTLTIEEMPSHNHQIHQWTYILSSGGGSGKYNISSQSAGNGNANYANEDTEYRTSYEAGGGQPHNNMPPYLAVYTWRRIS